jgi:hypothetical protein
MRRDIWKAKGSRLRIGEGLQPDNAIIASSWLQAHAAGAA